MSIYHFQIIDPTGGRQDIKSVHLAGARDVWEEIGALSLGRAAKGSQIRVTNEAGAIVVLVGVCTALSLKTRLAA